MLSQCAPVTLSANWRIRIVVCDVRRYRRMRMSRTNPVILTTCFSDSYRRDSSITDLLNVYATSLPNSIGENGSCTSRGGLELSNDPLKVISAGGVKGN